MILPFSPVYANNIRDGADRTTFATGVKRLRSQTGGGKLTGEMAEWLKAHAWKA
jgi:hypothetical protein